MEELAVDLARDLKRQAKGQDAEVGWKYRRADFSYESG
jgi:hypothetical protein